MRWLDDLVSFAHANLGDRELEALWSRGMSDEQIEAFQVGYLEGLPKVSLSQEFLAWSLRGRKLQDVFVFPLTNTLGQVKGVQFRHVERGVSGYHDYLPLKDEPAFFGLAQAMPSVWETEFICLVEGVFDLCPVHRVYPNTVATLTSSVSTSFLRLLRRNVKEVWFVYDMDLAGRKGVEEFLKKGDGFVVRTAQLPRVRLIDGRRSKDPSDLWEAVGGDQFGVYLRSAFKQVKGHGDGQRMERRD